MCLLMGIFVKFYIRLYWGILFFEFDCSLDCLFKIVWKKYELYISVFISFYNNNFIKGWVRNVIMKIDK